MLAGSRAVGDDKWAWHDTLPDGLDETTAVVYRQVEQENTAKLGGQLYLFADGQVWQRAEDGRWKRGIFTPGDLDSSMFERVTA